MLNIIIRKAAEVDLPHIARINSSVFLGNRDNLEIAEEWTSGLFNAGKIYHYFVAEVDGEIAGYIGWQIHGGFLRANPVLELEQLGVDPRYQGMGVGTKLQDDSLNEMVNWIISANNRIESHINVVVWCYAENKNAIRVYEKTFTDGIKGERYMYGSRKEIMFRLRVPMVRPVRVE